MTSPGRAILFDLDGTLLDLPVDIAAVRASLRALCAPWGIDLPFRPILADLAALPALLAPRYGEGAWLLAEAARARFDHLEALTAHEATPRPHGPAVVAEALARGIPLALVTNNGRRAALAALAAVGIDPRAFTAVVCRGEAPAPKPDAAPLRRALAALEAARGPVDQLLCVGDAPTDVAAARALGAEAAAAGRGMQVLAVAVARPPAPPPEGADIALDDLRQLWDKLQGRLSAPPAAR